jgi:hypothetical protein
MAERVLRSILLIGGQEHGEVVARIVEGDEGGFSGWLLPIDADRPMPSGFVDGWLRPTAGGPDIAVRLKASSGPRTYFTSRTPTG